MKKESLTHPFAPVYDHTSKILILGTFPSVKSRENDFYYGHPQNRFWRVLAKIFEEAPPFTVEEKIAFLLRHHIAVWDVLASCEITGSADSSIKAAVPNDIVPLLSKAPIQDIYTNGKKAQALYERYLLPIAERQAKCLPSTSPANAAWSLERLIAAWRQMKG